MKRRTAILISGRGSNMAALIDAAKAADFPAEIVAVISNRADAPGLERAEAGVPASRSKASRSARTAKRSSAPCRPSSPAGTST
jgi:folate-dependent phosphoribosylglycinamide formyltransferase PurN